MDADGKAYVYVTKCEIGQHVGTALAQAVAEELEINWDDKIYLNDKDNDRKTLDLLNPESFKRWIDKINSTIFTLSFNLRLKTMTLLINDTPLIQINHHFNDILPMFCLYRKDDELEIMDVKLN